MLFELIKVGVNHIQGEIDIHLKLLREPSVTQHIKDHLDLAGDTLMQIKDTLINKEELSEIE
jgi:hypothetical protein